MKSQPEIHLKILAYKSPQRYAVRKAVIAAIDELGRQHPALHVDVEEVRNLEQMEAITPVTIFPSLMLNGKLVCVGRFPRKEEIIAWLKQEIDITY